MPTPAHRLLTAWLAALALIGTMATAALAEPPPLTPVEDITNYAFDDDLVRGGVPTPQVEVLHARRRRERESLVRVRTHFVRELLSAAEQL